MLSFIFMLFLACTGKVDSDSTTGTDSSNTADSGDSADSGNAAE